MKNLRKCSATYWQLIPTTVYTYIKQILYTIQYICKNIWMCCDEITRSYSLSYSAFPMTGFTWDPSLFSLALLRGSAQPPSYDDRRDVRCIRVPRGHSHRYIYIDKGRIRAGGRTPTTTLLVFTVTPFKQRNIDIGINIRAVIFIFIWLDNSNVYAYVRK